MYLSKNFALLHIASDLAYARCDKGLSSVIEIIAGEGHLITETLWTNSCDVPVKFDESSR